ncbi:hypothetical protein BRC95_10265 [Halobacteriales archaeon QS_5_68_33]|nr:MAG: hypothetical protein BRC95_10265 [Halobacteriales archaeon QS_5_68_33]
MPHQCTNCGRTFADGSKEMLSGCPDCSGTKFQFRPEGFDGSGSASDGPGSGGTSSPGEPSDASGERSGDAVSRRVGSAAATVRDLVGGSAGSDATSARRPAGESADAPPEGESGPGSADPEDDIIVAECEPVAEDAAQADARGGLATTGDLPDDPGTDATEEDVPEPTAGTDDSRTAVSEPDSETADRPDLAELRRELNEQFESIRVVEPGQYELNLMELYDREEYIIALQEDGRYSIQVPEAWHDGDD